MNLRRAKYEYYASKARKGLQSDCCFFEETSHNEKEHAKIWFKLLYDGIPATDENLRMRQLVRITNGQRCMRVCKNCKGRRFHEIANLFERVAEIEKEHERDI